MLVVKLDITLQVPIIINSLKSTNITLASSLESVSSFSRYALGVLD